MAWTTPTNPVAGTVITVAYAVTNFINNLNWLRGLTGNADPPGTGYMVTSDSTTATSWKNGTTAILAVLGYVPVNKAGDSMSGNLSFSDNGEGVQFSDGSQARDLSGQGLVLNAHNNSFEIYDEGLTTTAILSGNLPSGPGSQIARVGSNEIWHDGNTTNKVTTAKIADNQVTNAKIPTGAGITHDKLAATPSGYNAGSPFAISTSNTTAASCNVGIAGVYEIHATFMVKMVANSAVNDANVAFTADLYKSSGIFGPQMRKYLPPVASAPGEGYDSQEYWMHFTIQQAMNASEPIAMVVVKSGGSGGTRCEQAIISAVRIGP